jgi:hypothetical protein
MARSSLLCTHRSCPGPATLPILAEGQPIAELL